MTPASSEIATVFAERTEHVNILHNINRHTYASEHVVSWYRDADFTCKAEEVILQRVYPSINGKKLLDIGIGGGRTTKSLLEVSRDYTGLDYTARLAEAAKRKYPQATVICADVRQLPISNECFDFALFSLNGLDYIDHNDRLQALKEIHRVLKPGSFYMFSTHNRQHKDFRKLPWQENTAFTLGHLKSCLYTLAHWPRHLMMKKHELETNEYAIVNDSAHGFSLLTYYISIGQQLRQLESEGFVHVEVYDLNGKQVESDTNFPWTYYLAQKPAG